MIYNDLQGIFIYLFLKQDVEWSIESSYLYITKEGERLYTFMYAEPLW